MLKQRVTPATLLWVFTGLFFGRVVGQILVAFLDVRFLPPMSEWYSGLLPYPLLLPVQIVMLVAMFNINSGITRGQSYFLRPRPQLAKGLFLFGTLYVIVMVVRYFVSGSLHPERRWLPPGSIPIFFHWVLAGYVFTLGTLAQKRA